MFPAVRRQALDAGRRSDRSRHGQSRGPLAGSMDQHEPMMHALPDDRLLSLFEFAVELAPGMRARFLEHACPDDGLRRKLGAMLAAQARSTGVLLHHDQIDDPVAVASRSLGPVVPNAPDSLGRRRARRSPPGEDALGPYRTSQDQLDGLIGPGLHVQHYELIREIGRGGMGAVYLARDTKLGRRVAVKFLRSNDRKQTARFVLEARATARCHHENIVVIHDVNNFQAIPYMVLEYLRGVALSELIEGDRLTPARAVQLMVPVVRALVCAHRHQIVHRDLKPANVMLTDTGTIKVLDFGIAKFLPDAATPVGDTALSATVELPAGAGHVDLTRASLVGTLPYMSPEQWGVAEVDGRSDLWAVGIMLYRMIVGRHPLGPLRGEQFLVITALDRPMPSAHAAGVAMPLALADLIDSCLQKRKGERMPSADKLLALLEQHLPGRPHEIARGEECPYAGLEAFQETDAHRFFGRAREVRGLVTRLHGCPLLAVAGPSGAGKSSLVRAGIMPALCAADEHWETLVMRPGRHPMAALANLVVPMLTGNSSLSEQVAEHQQAQQRLYDEPGYLGTVMRGRAHEQAGKLVLFIDQFEELFTLGADLDERQAFTDCLVGMADDATSPVRLVLAIRSDFLDRVAEHTHFMGELVPGLCFVSPPGRDGLRAAIVKPAEATGYRFDSPEMVERMLDELQESACSLPLLQFAASMLWEHRDRKRRVLTRASHDALGGVVGALATHADTVLSGLGPAEQRLVRSIFLHLVTSDRTRAVRTIEELCELTGADRQVEALVRLLVESRLLVVQTSEHTPPGESSTSTVELVHEAMIDSWPTLAHWLEDSQEDALALEQLHTAARQWHEHGRGRDLLWRGSHLLETQAWRRRYRDHLPPLPSEFLDASATHAARLATRKRWAIVGTMVFLAGVATAALVGLLAIRAAEQQLRAKEADRQELLEKYDGVREERTWTKVQLREALDALRVEHARTVLALGRAEEARAELSRSVEELEQQKVKLDRALRAERDATLAAGRAQNEVKAVLKRSERAETRATNANQEVDRNKARNRRRMELVNNKKKAADPAQTPLAVPQQLPDDSTLASELE